MYSIFIFIFFHLAERHLRYCAEVAFDKTIAGCRLRSSPSSLSGTQFLSRRSRVEQPTSFAGLTTRHRPHRQRDCVIWHRSGCMSGFLHCLRFARRFVDGRSWPTADITVGKKVGLSFASRGKAIAISSAGREDFPETLLKLQP